MNPLFKEYLATTAVLILLIAFTAITLTIFG